MEARSATTDSHRDLDKTVVPPKTPHDTPKLLSTRSISRKRCPGFDSGDKGAHQFEKPDDASDSGEEYEVISQLRQSYANLRLSCGNKRNLIQIYDARGSRKNDRQQSSVVSQTSKLQGPWIG